MPNNPFFESVREKLSRTEFQALQVLKSYGWIVMTDVQIEDGRPEIGDGNLTYRYDSRQPIAIIKNRRTFELAEPVENVSEAVADPEVKKKRGRPKKL